MPALSIVTAEGKLYWRCRECDEQSKLLRSAHVTEDLDLVNYQVDEHNTTRHSVGQWYVAFSYGALKYRVTLRRPGGAHIEVCETPDKRYAEWIARQLNNGSSFLEEFPDD